MGNPFTIMDEIRKTSVKGTGMNHTTWMTGEKTIHFIRHAQAQHNATGDHSIPDPRLTAEGVRQAQRIKDGIPADVLAHLELIVCSPMRRTIQTTLLAFHRQIEWQGVPVKLSADLQEKNGHPCDTGSPQSILLSEFPQLEKEINELPVSWYLKQGDYASDRASLEKRAAKFTSWLLSRPEKIIVVVSHNGFLEYLVGNEFWTSSGTAPNGFENAEVKSFSLDSAGKLHRNIQVLTANHFAEEVERVGYLD